MGGLAQGIGIFHAERVDTLLHGVDRCSQFCHVLSHILVAHTLLVHSVEVGVECHHYLFHVECFTPVWDVLHACGCVFEVLERFSAPQFEKEVGLVGREAHLS